MKLQLCQLVPILRNALKQVPEVVDVLDCQVAQAELLEAAGAGELTLHDELANAGDTLRPQGVVAIGYTLERAAEFAVENAL